MSIPNVRVRLHELADLYGIDELHELAEATRRRTATRRTVPQSRPMTPELGDEIRAYAANHPRATLGRIAQVFDINAGRVSEALQGRWA